MHNQTEQSEKSQPSTKFSINMKPATIFTDVNRQMHRKEHKKPTKINDIAIFQPSQISGLIYPGIHMIDDVSYVTVQDNYYVYTDNQHKKHFYCRNAQAKSELIYFKAMKPNMTLYMICVQKCNKYENQIGYEMLHINLRKEKNEESSVKDIYVKINQVDDESMKNHKKIRYQWINLIELDSFKKGIICLRKILPFKADNQDKQICYQLQLIDMTQTNKQYVYQNQINKSKSGEIDPFSLLLAVLPTLKRTQSKIQIFSSCVLTTLDFFHHFIKGINSQYGDMVTIVTSKQLYQLEINEERIMMQLKPMNIGRFLQAEQEITDAMYLNNSLRIIVITSKGKIMMSESQQLLFSSPLLELRNYPKQPNLNVQFDKIYTLPGSIVITQKKSHKCDLLKILESSVSFERRFLLSSGVFLSPKDYQLCPINTSNELVLQYFQDKNQKSWKVEKIALFSAKSVFNQFCSFHMIHPQKYQVRFAQMSLVSRTIFVGLQNSLIAWRISENEFEKLAQISFFQYPNKISVHPLGHSLILTFKQFVKFFYYEHTQISLYYTINQRNINYASYNTDGTKIIICIDNIVRIINAYTFEQLNKINIYAAQINQVTYISEQKLLLRQPYSFFYFEGINRLGEIKNQPNSVSYSNDKQLIIIKPNGDIQLYLHEKIGKSMNLETLLQKKHENAFNFYLGQHPTCMLALPQYGFMFIGTNFGILYEIFWPLFNIEDHEAHKIQISSSSIMKLKIDAQYTKLYAVCSNNSIHIIDLKQFIDGESMFSPYTFNQKLRGQKKQKRELCSRQYLLDSYTIFTQTLNNSLIETIDELELLKDKNKDDIQQDVSKTSTGQQVKISQQIKSHQALQQNLQKEHRNLKMKFENDLGEKKKQIQQKQQTFQTTKKRQIEQYEKKLLDLYKENDRLKRVMNDQNIKLTKQRNQLIHKHNNILFDFENQKDKQYHELFSNYKKIETQYHNYIKQATFLKEQEQIQFQQYKQVIQQQVIDEYNRQQQKKQHLLGSNSILEKQISNLHQRSAKFDTLIAETKQQLSQLYEDKIQYLQKRKYLQVELKDKQSLIQEKEKQLQIYIDNTQYMKKVKNTHQYQLDANEGEIQPILTKMVELDSNIKKINEDIMEAYNQKIEHDHKIQIANEQANIIRKKHYKKTLENLQMRTRLLRFTQQLNKILVNNSQTSDRLEGLSKLIVGQYVHINEQKNKMKQANKLLLRKKSMIKKQIQQQQKRDQQMLSNQYQLKKYQIDNTTLVRQYNELTKQHRKIKCQKEQLQRKIEQIKTVQFRTPIRAASTDKEKMLRKLSQTKLTPYQKYQRDFVGKNDTTETKLTRSGQSVSLLKSLIKDVGATDSTYEKMQVVRQRIRTFVNPELKFKKTIYMEKILLQRPKINSDIMRGNRK